MLDSATEHKRILPFGISDVALTHGFVSGLKEVNSNVIRSMTANTILYTFRYNANEHYGAHFDLPDTPFGGWASPGHVFAGHFEGHYMTAASMLYVQDRDEALKETLIAVVEGLAEVQEVIRTRVPEAPVGYLSGFPETRFDVLESGSATHVPWYMIHKIMQGLLDVYTYVGYPKALAVVERMSDWVCWRTGRLTREHMLKVLDVDEYGGMQDVLVNLWKVTENKRYLELSERFSQRETILRSLYEGKDNLTGLHANTYLAKIVSAASAYNATQDSYYRTVTEAFWENVVQGRTYITGGNSIFERFTDPHKLSEHMHGNTCETCNVYNMLKITRALFGWTGDVTYADYYERALFNQIFGSIHRENGDKTYFQFMSPRVRKDFRSNRNGNFCCNGTGLESFTKLQDSIYFHTENELYVNLFINSVLTWKEKSLILEQTTEFPWENTSVIRIRQGCDVPISVKIRIPCWCNGQIDVRVNHGDRISANEADGYVTIDRIWETVDVITVSMDMGFDVIPTTDNENVIAITYGPLVMAAVECDDMNGHVKATETNAAIRFIKDNLSIHTVDPFSAVLTTEYGTKMKLIPYCLIQNESHSVYWTLVCK